MKTTSMLCLLLFFFCAQTFGAVPGTQSLVSQGIFVTFGSHALKTELIQESGFAFMTIDDAQKLRVSKAQMDSYNRDVDLLNSMMAEISKELGAMKEPTLDDAVGLWSGLKGAVSSTTLEALRKITKSN